MSDAVDQQERKAVRQDAQYVLDVEREILTALGRRVHRFAHY